MILSLKSSIKVFIGTPQLSHSDHYKNYLGSVLNCVKAQETGVTLMPLYITPPYSGKYSLGNKDRLEAIVDRLNNIITKFTQSDATHLWIIDGDVEPPPDAVDTLLRHNVDVASGVYPHKYFNQNKLMLFGRMSSTNPCGFYHPRHWDKLNGLVMGEDYPVSGGNGCMLIKRRVFKRWHQQLQPIRFTRENGCGGDVSFWKKIQDAGFTARLDANIVCGHMPRYRLADVDKWCYGEDVEP